MKQEITVRGLGTTSATGTKVIIENSVTSVLVVIEIQDDGSRLIVKNHHTQNVLQDKGDSL